MIKVLLTLVYLVAYNQDKLCTQGSCSDHLLVSSCLCICCKLSIRHNENQHFIVFIKTIGINQEQQKEPRNKKISLSCNFHLHYIKILFYCSSYHKVQNCLHIPKLNSNNNLITHQDSFHQLVNLNPLKIQEP